MLLSLTSLKTLNGLLRAWDKTSTNMNNLEDVGELVLDAIQGQSSKHLFVLVKRVF